MDTARSSSLRCLSGNTLKLLALITMTFDHVGLELMGNFIPFRIIGRLAFPLFAYMIAEGCQYTHNKKKYFLGVFLLGLLCQLVYFLAEGSLYQCILITFSLSILLIFSLQWAKEKRGGAWLVPAAGVILTALICYGGPLLLPGTDFAVDYGFWGVLLPVLVSLSKRPGGKLGLTALGLVLVSLYLGGVQWFSLLALIPLALYSGKRGKYKMKYLFYIYYPAHLAVIYLISLVI